MSPSAELDVCVSLDASLFVIHRPAEAANDQLRITHVITYNNTCSTVFCLLISTGPAAPNNTISERKCYYIRPQREGHIIASLNELHYLAYRMGDTQKAQLQSDLIQWT